MLKHVKTSYFLRILFSYVDEKQKLKLIKYNKSLQVNLNISLINYKYFSGRYIIYESNGIGKEYNNENDILLFEGEYKNGKRNGKGKEYYYGGKLEFEGEYLNGKINGKGKEYDSNGKIKFEGEYLYSYKLSGKYNINGKLEYEGEFLYNKKWNGKGYDENGNIIYELKNGTGKVKEYYPEVALEFEGEYLNGKRNGKGKEYYKDKLRFEGKYLNDQRNGKGKEYDSNGKIKFEGEYLNGIKVMK